MNELLITLIPTISSVGAIIAAVISFIAKAKSITNSSSKENAELKKALVDAHKENVELKKEIEKMVKKLNKVHTKEEE